MKAKLNSFIIIFILIFSAFQISSEDFKFSLFSTIEINADKDMKNIFGTLNTVSFCEALPGLDNLLKFGDISIIPYFQFNLIEIEYINAKTRLSFEKINNLSAILSKQEKNFGDKNLAPLFEEFNNLKKELSRNINTIYTSRSSNNSSWLNLKNEKIRLIFSQLSELRLRIGDIINDRENAGRSVLADATDSIDEILILLEQFGDNWNFNYFCELLIGANIEFDITNLRKLRNHNQTVFIGAETNIVDYSKTNNAVKIGFKIKDAEYSDKIYGFKFNNIFSGRENFSYGIFGGSQIFKY